MNRPARTLTVVAERMFSRLMVVLPRDFRSIHGADIAEAFRDSCHDSHARAGLPGLIATSVRGFWGLIVVGVRERFRGAGVTHRGVGLRRRESLARRTARDVRYSVRSYRRNPGFAVTAVGIAALGIGATTTIFSVVDGVVFKPLPYPEPSEIVLVDNGSHPPTRFRDWQDNIESLRGWSAARDRDLDLTGEGTPERLDAAFVTGNFFATFGGRPVLGRLFVNGEFTTDPDVVVLSYQLWQRRFGSDPGILDRTIRLGEERYTVVGVLDRRFRPPEGVVRPKTDVWIPLDETGAEIQQDGLYILDVVARLDPDIALATAQAEIDALTGALAEEHPGRYVSRGNLRSFPLVGLHTATVAQVEDTLLMLFGAVTLLLLIACANIANLLLARGTYRTREMTVRLALGASRGRLIGQLLTESVILAILGGVFGVALAFAGVGTLQVIGPDQLPNATTVAVNVRALTFAFSIAVGTGVLFGVAPALRTVKKGLATGIHGGTRSVGTGRAHDRLRNMLVITEIALALVLATGAGLLLNSFVRLNNVDPGFNTEQLIVVPFKLGSIDLNDKTQLTDQLAERVGAIPGVDAVAGGALVPYQYYGNSRCCRAWSRFTSDDGTEIENELILVHPVTDGYFGVLNAPVNGRDLLPTDGNLIPMPAIITSVLAERLFGTRNAVNRTFTGRETQFQVVGVTEGLHQWGLDQQESIEMFVPYKENVGGLGEFSLVVRTGRSLASVAPELRSAIWEVAPDMPVDDIYTMQQRINESTSGPRFYSIVLLTFGAVAMVLAAGGVYGSMFYGVSQRSRELGLRMALGATTTNLTRMVVKQGVYLAAGGIVIGIAGALGMGRLLEGLMFGITPTDPLTLAAAAVTLGVVAIVAAYLPARRASRADPVEVLRGE